MVGEENMEYIGGISNIIIYLVLVLFITMFLYSQISYPCLPNSGNPP